MIEEDGEASASSDEEHLGTDDPDTSALSHLVGGSTGAKGPLEVSVEDRSGTPIVHVAGELDLSTCEELDAAVRRAEGSNPATLVLDLGLVSFLDSTGVRTLLQADARARRVGRRLLLIGPPDPAARVLRVTLLDKRFDFIKDLSELD